MEGIKKALEVAGRERNITRDDLTVFAGDAATPRRHGDFHTGLSTIVYTQTRVVAVSEEQFERARIKTGNDEEPATRAYKLLRTQVLQRVMSEGWQTIAVVSPSSREGKTLTAINLGIALASSGSHSVMLVDLDWRRPSVHNHFGIDPEHDIGGFLRGESKLQSAIVNPGIPRFCFVPCKQPIAHSSELLGGGAVRSLVEELRNRYRNRLIIFDLPPMLATDDALSFLPNVDCVLLVIEEGRTRRADMAHVLDMIGPQRLLGTVVNKSSYRLPGY